jgi:hypothetical protein
VSQERKQQKQTFFDLQGIETHKSVFIALNPFPLSSALGFRRRLRSFAVGKGQATSWAAELLKTTLLEIIHCLVFYLKI